MVNQLGLGLVIYNRKLNYLMKKSLFLSYMRKARYKQSSPGLRWRLHNHQGQPILLLTLAPLLVGCWAMTSEVPLFPQA